MRSKMVKLTLEDLLEILLSHGIKPKKIEAIMASLGIPRRCTGRALASVITSFPQGRVKDLSGSEKRKRGSEARQSWQCE